MPYTLKKENGGYRVHSPNGPKSKKPLTRKKALAQQAALYANADPKNESKLPGVMFGYGFKRSELCQNIHKLL
jgi:hypothetical protein